MIVKKCSFAQGVLPLSTTTGLKWLIASVLASCDYLSSEISNWKFKRGTSYQVPRLGLAIKAANFEKFSRKYSVLFNRNVLVNSFWFLRAFLEMSTVSEAVVLFELFCVFQFELSSIDKLTF